MTVNPVAMKGRPSRIPTGAEGVEVALAASGGSMPPESTIPVRRGALDEAAGFMDEYAEVFEKLAR